MNDIVAEMALTGQHPNGKIISIVVYIGRPYWKGEIYAKAYCPVEVQGLNTPIRDIPGEDTLAALMGATRIAADLLKDFIEQGGKLYASDNKTNSSGYEIREDERVTIDFLDLIFRSKL